ncbi:hypothetical protein [Rhizobium sp. R634]|nr:hypothetical protein [Rhizobium sp. R634]
MADVVALPTEEEIFCCVAKDFWPGRGRSKRPNVRVVAVLCRQKA